MKQRLWLWYLVAGAIGGLAYYYVPPFAKSGPFFNVLGASSVFVILVGVKWHRPAKRLPWMLFALGQWLFISGDVITYNYDKLFGTSIPFPSIGDVFYLSVYPCLIAGVLVLIRSRTPGRDRDGFIDSLIITIGAGLLAWEFLMAPYAHDYTLSPLVKVVSIAYPMMDLLLLGVLVRLGVGSGRREPAFYLLTFGAISLLATDAAYQMVQLSGVIYQNGGPLEAGWLAFYLLWGAAALHPSMRRIGEAVEAPQRAFPRGRLILLAAASLMAPAVQVIQSMRHDERVDAFTIVGAAALFLLVVARIAGVVRKHESAEARERALREAGASFVAATGREDLYRAAVEAVHGLVGPSGEVRLVVAVASSLPESHVAGNGNVVRYVESIPSSIQDAVAGGQLVAIDQVRVDRRFCKAIDLESSTPNAIFAPLRMGDALGGLLVVAPPTPLTSEATDGLKALASQIALALESEVLTEDLHRRQSEERFASLVQNSSDMITSIDLDLNIRYQSPSSQMILGRDAADMLGTNLVEYIHPDDQPKLVGFLVDIAGLQDRPSAIELRWLHRDGTWLRMEALVSDLTRDPNVAGLVLNTRDVTERAAFEEQLSHQAFHDSLTGLANRKLFRDRVEHALERQRRDDRPIGVLFIDIDDFKTVNDSLGHAAGDVLLQEVASRLKTTLRAADTAARLGGDEFGLLLEDAGYTLAAEVAERVMETLDAPFQLQEQQVFVRASIGIAIGDDDRQGGDGAEDLLRNADVAMYTAKGQGKARYQVFEPDMHVAVLRRLELKADLQRAVEHGDFVLHYQPIVHLLSGEITGVEALVRWKHQLRGLIPPLDFIPLAEETGLIVPIGRWVLREACREAVRLQTEFPKVPPLTMSVNLSMRQLQDHELITTVQEVLNETGISPRSLVMEVTETVMMKDIEVAALRLTELRELGVQIAVDDFGTGYSSLSRLRRFPVDMLKVDKSFVDEVTGRGDHASLTAAVVQLAENLDLIAVAEGIEREDQLSRLRDLHCRYGQGFLFSKPVDPRRLRRLITSGLVATKF
jgi:diguanylate cyclase (GGDEF)-like protein/PAS domain S-box-containing protein